MMWPFGGCDEGWRSTSAIDPRPSHVIAAASALEGRPDKRQGEPPQLLLTHFRLVARQTHWKTKPLMTALDN